MITAHPTERAPSRQEQAGPTLRTRKVTPGWVTDSTSLSIIVPCYNEQECVGPLARELRLALEPLPHPWEVILVDDRSTDRTWPLMRALNRLDGRFVGLRLAQNSGQTAATLAGIRHATGEVVITMDADLQHHPSDIPTVLERLNEGHAVVSTWRADRADEPAGKRIPSRISNSLARLLTGVPAHDFGSGFKGYFAPRLEGLILYGSFHRYIPALVLQPDDVLGEVPIDYRLRVGGKTKYDATRLLKGVRDLIYITCLTRLGRNLLARAWARFMVRLHYDGGAPTYRVAEAVGIEEAAKERLKEA